MLRVIREPFVWRLADTATMRRLKKISFLGALDYSPWARGVQRYLTDRYSHSLGVARLAAHAAERLQLSPKDRDEAIAAALLHDAGHGPLSHSLENEFDAEYGVNHHKATEKLILGDGKYALEIRCVLREYGIDEQKVLGLICGDSDHPMSALFSGPINIDTIEGISRVLSYKSHKVSRHTPIEIVDAVVCLIRTNKPNQDAIGVMDHFWTLKGLAYSQLVRGPVGLISDHKCKLFFQKHKSNIAANHFSLDEKMLRMEFPAMFSWLQNDAAIPGGDYADSDCISYTKRHFFISDASFSDAESFMTLRYQQSKAPSTFKWHPHNNSRSATAGGFEWAAIPNSKSEKRSATLV